MTFIACLFACLYAIHALYVLLALLEWSHQWEGFKVCRNGAVYNISAKRFATRQERKGLSCLTDLI